MWREEMVFKQLNNKNNISKEKLNEIASLIYDTDPYIYPAMFQCRKDAIIVFSELIREGKDEFFCLNNLFVAEEQNHVIGIVLWYRGRLKWKKDLLLDVAYRNDIKLPETFERVCQEYFHNYAEIEIENLISIINVCIDEKWRGEGVGKLLLTEFIKNHDECMELYCLKDNEGAMRLYEKMGFFTVLVCDAFTVEESDVKCVKMMKYIS